MKVNIDEFRRKLEEYIDPYEIPGAMEAFIESSEDTNHLGEWRIVKDNDEPMIECSICECRMIKASYDNAVGNRGYHYCPYCGSQMAPYKWRWDPWLKRYRPEEEMI